MTALDGLQSRLGYRFNDPQRLLQALTHRSMGGIDNERLEFLGDGLLNALIGEALYLQNPRHDEGALSRLRSSLVREATLCDLARHFDLGPHLRLGESERKSGGQRRDSILADAVEAILAAIYLDGGFDAARQSCLRWFDQSLADLPDPETLKDPKTRLQEWLQSTGRALPIYRVIDASGPPHRRTFVARCILTDTDEQAEATAGSRRNAEQQAAERLLQQLTENSPHA
ncbi:ribonuclease III [Polycyclovorans algicola]|uniref:ribonuclease III n=1 Tax=Polycyclovorans algicola TaxID=616992 RepID=UPI0004A74F85|nr:ribonuclease III [Polycyclovorans algicola]